MHRMTRLQELKDVFHDLAAEFQLLPEDEQKKLIESLSWLVDRAMRTNDEHGAVGNRALSE